MSRLERAGRWRRDRAGADSGFTMIEVVVTLTIMSIVMVLFTTGILQAYSAETRVDSGSTVQSQITVVFQRLDKEVRYAVAISQPGTSGTYTFVEFLSTYTGKSICTELRLNSASGQLQQRTWTYRMSPLVPGPWSVLASGVTSSTPFVLIGPGAGGNTYLVQRLTVALTVQSLGNSTKATKYSTITFSALNTAVSGNSLSSCTEGRVIS